MKRFGVAHLALPGFLARGRAGPVSSVNVLIAFNCQALSACYFGPHFCLQALLRCSVNLMTGKALRSDMRPLVDKEAVHV